MVADLPIALAAKVAARNLKQAIWAVVCDNLFIHASRTPYLLTILAVKEVLQGKETIVRSRGAGVKGSFVVFGRTVGNPVINSLGRR